MKALLPLSVLLVGAAPIDHPHSYLLSIVNLPLKTDESLESFSISTWGVEFDAICHIPGGWRIKAGSSATPDGELDGEGSQGATWFNRASPKELHNFVLVTLYNSIQKDDVRSGSGEIPASFKGSATISADEGEPKRPLTYKNIRLFPAQACPLRR